MSFKEGFFEGYASLFSTPDLAGDVIVPGAFARSLRSRSSGDIKMLYQHDSTQPLGVWQMVREDAKGLFVRGRLLLEIPRVREVFTLMRAGALDSLSIGFRAVRALRRPRTGARLLREIHLVEVSIVTFPMQPAARLRLPILPCAAAHGFLTTSRRYIHE